MRPLSSREQSGNPRHLVGVFCFGPPAEAPPDLMWSKTGVVIGSTCFERGSGGSKFGIQCVNAFRWIVCTATGIATLSTRILGLLKGWCWRGCMWIAGAWSPTHDVTASAPLCMVQPPRRCQAARALTAPGPRLLFFSPRGAAAVVRNPPAPTHRQWSLDAAVIYAPWGAAG